MIGGRFGGVGSFEVFNVCAWRMRGKGGYETCNGFSFMVYKGCVLFTVRLLWKFVF